MDGISDISSEEEYETEMEHCDQEEEEEEEKRNEGGEEDIEDDEEDDQGVEPCGCGESDTAYEADEARGDHSGSDKCTKVGERNASLQIAVGDTAHSIGLPNLEDKNNRKLIACKLCYENNDDLSLCLKRDKNEAHSGPRLRRVVRQARPTRMECMAMLLPRQNVECEQAAESDSSGDDEVLLWTPSNLRLR